MCIMVWSEFVAPFISSQFVATCAACKQVNGCRCHVGHMLCSYAIAGRPWNSHAFCSNTGREEVQGQAAANGNIRQRPPDSAARARCKQQRCSVLTTLQDSLAL